MVISVLERRSEIGLRRVLGATRRHVAERSWSRRYCCRCWAAWRHIHRSAAATVIYAVSQHWSVTIPLLALYGGVGAALIFGAVAGLYSSMRAARISPTEALRTV
jgi:putative ABC transport system permease protein